MFKKAVVIGTIIFIVLVVLFGGSAPYALYVAILTEKIHFPNYYSLPSKEKRILKGEEKSLGAHDDSEGLWKPYHLLHYQIKLPNKHPLYQAYPYLLSKISDKSRTSTYPLYKKAFGFTIRTAKGEAILNFIPLSFHTFTPDFKRQELFNIPALHNILQKKSLSKIWRDLFVTNISQWKRPYEDLIYQLYLLDERSYFFNSKENLFYLKGLGVGGIQYLDKEKEVWVLNYLVGDIVYRFKLEIFERDEKLISSLLSSLIIEPSSVDFSKKIYNKFMEGPFYARSTNDGLLTLFSAWTHEPSNPDFIKELFYYLHKGDENEKYYRSLINYSKLTFDHQESADGKLESPQEALDRKIREEMIESAEKDTNQPVENTEYQKSRSQSYRERLKKALETTNEKK
jgi:hypothetical protein